MPGLTSRRPSETRVITTLWAVFGVHFEFLAQRPHRRKGLAGKKLASHESLLHRIDYLLVRRPVLSSTLNGSICVLLVLVHIALCQLFCVTISRNDSTDRPRSYKSEEYPMATSARSAGCRRERGCLGCGMRWSQARLR